MLNIDYFKYKRFATTRLILLFAFYPVFLYSVGYLGFGHAGEILITGTGTLAIISILSTRLPKYTRNNTLLTIISFIFFLYIVFFGALRDIFGMAQDNIIVMQAIYGTDTNEAIEFFSQYKVYIYKHIVIFIILFSSFFFLGLRGKKYDDNSSNIVIVLWILFFIITHLERPMRHANPFLYFSYYHSVWAEELTRAKLVDTKISHLVRNNDINYTKKSKKNTIVWVIGESSSKYDWSLYGYDRDTTPKIDKIKNDLLVFEDIYSAAPVTIPAIERMLTPATLKKKDLWLEQPDIISIAKIAGYHTYWISNHTTDAFGIISIFANHADETILTNKGKARGEGSYDETLLPSYQKALDDKYDKKFIIVHTLESHPAYNYRYPDSYARFTKSFDDKIATNLSKQGRAKWAILFRNTYDNSVLYSDMIHFRLLDSLQKSRDKRYSAYLYHPDHGEDVLAHNNYAGHNPRVKEQWQIPMLYWDNDINKYKKTTTYPYRLDEINHTLLGLLGISTKYYNSKYDIFSKDFKQIMIKSFDGKSSINL